jgi:epidermal growth factor receptor substrate 15
MNENNFNYQEFENNYELRKALNKLENELHKRSNELAAMTDLYKDLKQLNGKIKKENDDLNNKLITVRNDMNKMEEKYQNEIDTIKSDNYIKIEKYESEITKLSQNDPQSIRKRIERDIENKFKQQLITKDKEIEQLSKELNQIKQDKELLNLEYETYKNDSKSDLDNIKRLFQTQIDSLLDKIRLTDNLDKFDGQSNDNTQLKNELDSSKRQISELNNEIDKLRHEKELLTIEKTDYQLNLMKMQDSQNFTQKKLQADLNKAYGDLENMKNENKRLSDNLYSQQAEINDLLKDRENLKNIINNHETEFIETRGMIQSFKNVIKMKEEEKNNYLKEKELNFNEMIIKERKEKEEYENQIKELNDKLAEAKSDNMIKKENEIKQLREELNKYKSQKVEDNDLYEELEETKKKKNEYKLQCKMANENIEAIIKKLNEQQKKDFMTIIKRTKEKYLK